MGAGTGSKTIDGEVSLQEFRQILGRFATGITVLTAVGGEEVHATTANSFTSVSLDPPLVLVCIAKDGRFESMVRASGRYCVNVLGEQHEEISNRFARKRNGDLGDFADISSETTATGHPILGDCLAHLECSVQKVVDGGDHTIFIGRVDAATQAAEDTGPLIFFRGQYRWLTGWRRTPVGDPAGLSFPSLSL
jgi:3-hydroxy-9,10-secoandrosta-1,3,5(10)-triene-9,17-dione monooxygenase reductase component